MHTSSASTEHAPPAPLAERLRTAIDGWLPQPSAPARPIWQFLPHLLLLAFVLRAALALSGDFIIHPDEIMQYLEPAHTLVFGNGILHWEYYYGARSWLVPGGIAAILFLCKVLGLGEPAYYIPAVKLTLCAFSLLIPLCLYHIGRRLFSEYTARAALLFAVFWYELVGFAHKPMTEFIATALFLTLLTFLLRPQRLTPLQAAAASAFAVFIVAIRLQYAPLVGILWLIPFWQGDARTRLLMLAATATTVGAVGLFDKLTWGEFLQPYWIVFNFNAALDNYRHTPGYYLLWLTLCSGGLLLAALLAATGSRERLFLLLLILAIFIPHELQVHREYRYVFGTIPLWLLLCADFLCTGLAGRRRTSATFVRRYRRSFIRDWSEFSAATFHRWRRRVMWIWVGFASLAGITNALPGQGAPYAHTKSLVNYPYFSHFLRNQDELLALYRRLAADSSVRGIKDSINPYHTSGGYYTLHRKVPFYDITSPPTADMRDSVSHFISSPFTITRGVQKNSNGDWVLLTQHGYTIRLPTYISDAARKQLVYWDKNGQPSAVKGFVPAIATSQYTLWKAETPAAVRTWKNYRIYLRNKKYHQWLEEALGSVGKPPLTHHNIEFADNPVQK